MKAKIGEKLKKHSVAAKIIPAVAMLATSAVMLSTATYAWFTLGKEVKVTGLNMTATSAGGLEISLGGVNASDSKLADNLATQPSDDVAQDISWTTSIVAAEYYKTIDLVKPSSSVDGINFFDAKDASNAGKKATKFEDVTGAAKEVALKQSTLAKGETKINPGTGSGYVVDIPVHIRTSKQKTGESTTANVYYKMTIDDNGADGDKELFKAVRVAFIKSDGNASIILGADGNYYESGQAVNSDSSRGTVTVTTDSVFSGEDTGTAYKDGTIAYNASPGTDSELDIPYAPSSSEYGHLDFTVRIWLEGESTSCFDQNSGQSWNIGLAFSLGEFETT